MWVGFIVFVHLMLALDRGVFHRKAHVVTVKEALTWSGVGATLGLTFSVCVCCGHENHWLGLGSAIHPVDGVIKVRPAPPCRAGKSPLSFVFRTTRGLPTRVRHARPPAHQVPHDEEVRARRATVGITPV